MSSSINNALFRNLLLSWPQKAMVLLYQDHYHKLISIADMYTHDRANSEDVLQKVFADIWRKHKTLGQQSDQPFEAYLIKAIQYQAITLYKKNTQAAQRHKEYYYAQSNTSFENPIETSLISAEKQSFIRLVVASFPLKERECLLLQIDRGMGVGEIARHLGVSQKAVERSLTSARKRLKPFRVVLE